MKLHLRAHWCWVGLALWSAGPLCVASCSLNPQSEPPGLTNAAGPEKDDDGTAAAPIPGAGGALATSGGTTAGTDQVFAADAASNAAIDAAGCSEQAWPPDGGPDAGDASPGISRCSPSADAGVAPSAQDAGSAAHPQGGTSH